jgi:hypothetical protein
VVWHRLSAALFVAALTAPVLSAQDTTTAGPLPHAIRAIRLTRHNIFTEREATSFLPRLVNRFHVTTRASVVERELLFEAGHPLDSLKLAESARNLRRLGVFRTVRIDTVRVEGGLDVHVETRDGWSTKPEFGLRSTGGQVAWRVSLTEENLLGTASRLLFLYYDEPDRSALVMSFRQPRLIAGRIGLSAYLEDRSDGTIAIATVSQAFHTLRDRHAWNLGVDSRDERILRYFDGEPVPRDTLQRQFDMVFGAYAWAFTVGDRVYHRVGMSGQLWRDDYAIHDEPLPSSRLAFATLGAFWEWRRARYLVVRGLSGAKEQDVDVSTRVWAGLFATPSGMGWEENGVGALLSVRYGGVVQRGMFGYLDLNAGGRFTQAGLDSGSVQVAGTAVWSPFEGHAGVVHLWSGWLRNPRPGSEFDLGLGLGPRGFRLHAFTGDRAYFGTAEYRMLVRSDWFKLLDLGLAAFVDHGGAWYRDGPRRTGWDGGLGLRIGPSRSTDLDLTRIDLVRRGRTDVQEAGWVIVIGRGLAFSLAGVMPR